MWVWQHPEWPDYVYNASAFAGRVEALSAHNQENAVVDLMLSEAITTSAIKGENLDRDLVRLALLKLLGRETIKERSIA